MEAMRSLSEGSLDGGFRGFASDVMPAVAVDEIRDDSVDQAGVNQNWNPGQDQAPTPMMHYGQMERMLRLLEIKEARIATLESQQSQACVSPGVLGLPVLPNVVPNFSGKEDYVRTRDWLEQLKSCAALHGWTDAYTLEMARLHLSGAAKNWYAARRDQIRTFKLFETAFTRSFLRAYSTAQKWEMMQKRVKSPKEDMAAYMHEKYLLCSGLSLNLEEVKEQILIGLNCPDRITGLMAAKYNNVDELFDDLLSFERLTAVRNRPSAKAMPTQECEGTSGVTPVREKGVLRCHRCKETGHFVKDCSVPNDIKCYKCNKPGHIRKYCPVPEKTVSENKSKQNVNVVASLKGTGSLNKFLRVVRLNDIYLTGLVDMGSAVTTIRNSAAVRCNLKPSGETINLYGYGNDSVPATVTMGIVSGKLELDGVSENVELCVVTDNVQSVDILVGRSFTELPGVAYVKKDNVLLFGARETEPFASLDLSESTRQIELMATESSQLDSGRINLIQVGSSVGEFIIPVLNDSVKDIYIEKGTIIGEVRQSGCVKSLEESETEVLSPIEAKDLDVGEDTPPEAVNELVNLCNEYRMCFALNLQELGCTNLVKMDVKDSNEPVRSKPYRVSASERNSMSRIVSEWKDNGIVEDTDSEYASPCLLVYKNSGEPRLVIDYRLLNRQTKRMNFPIPTVEEQFEGLSDCNIFSVLDLASGYLQIKLTEEAKKKCAFITPDTCLQPTRMMFGLCNAPYEFSRLMAVVLGPLRGRVVMWYLDDVLVPAKNWRDMMNKLREVFMAFKNANLTLKLRKCQFGMRRVEYLGYTLCEGGIQPSKRKSSAVSDFPTPRNVHEVRRFLGLTSYFRRFVPDYARRARNLTELTRKGVVFEWDPGQQAAFEDLKKTLGSRPLLKLYDPKARFGRNIAPV